MTENSIEVRELTNWLYRPVFAESWCRYNLYDLAIWTNGMAFRNINFASSGLPVIKIAEIKNGLSGQTKFTQDKYDSCYFITEGDMLFSWSGQPETSIDVFWWNGPNGWLNQHIFKVEPNEKYCHRSYFYYLLRYLKPNFISIARNKQTTGLGHVTVHDLKNIKVSVPSLSEQHAIAYILGTLDDKIELNRQMNKTLEKMALATFKSWFIDFEPFRSEGMQESPLGLIPVGWVVRKISQAIEINPPRKLDRGIEAPYIEMASLPTSTARVTDISNRVYTGSGSRFRNEDVLFARITPCLENGKTAIVDFLKDEEVGWGSTEFIVLGPRPPINMPFIYCLARNPEFRNHAIQAMTGTSGRQRVDSKCFDFYYLAIPPSEVIIKFQEIVRPWFQMLKINDEESKSLAKIRDILLPKLLTGEVKVKNIERFEEEVG